MSPELEEFRQRVLKHSTLAVSRAPKIDNEAKTNASLVQPFLAILGYDVGNPDEVSPEHHADFSDKYQNKVDYAILHLDAPVIALESKRVGSVMKDDRGQLRSYFNACPTVKLGILTDGLKYELYADSDKPNMMDETAFLRFDFAEIAKNGSIDNNTLDGIAAI
jgi:predicted type IV restriction endonuclease